MTHTIVALWSHPRSMSTATERIMRERGDCAVFHEPFLADYYLNRAVRKLRLFEPDPSLPIDYNGARAAICDAAERGPVFFKDMSYYVMPRILEDPELLRRLHHVFLIRDPRLSIASYAKLDPDLSLPEIGLEAQWRHYAHLRDVLNLAPLVVEAEAIAHDPRGVLGKVWAYCGWPFVDAAFDWQTRHVPEDWKPVAGWHETVLKSSGIRTDARDPDEVFGAAADKLPHLRDLLAHHEPFYEKLRAEAQRT